MRTLADDALAAIQYSLDNLCVDNAVFLAERMCGHAGRSEQSVHVLARCLLLAGRPNQARMVLVNTKSPQNRYLLATCFYRLGKYPDAERALMHGASLHDNLEMVPNGAAGLLLLGRVLRATNRPEHAAKCFTAVLQRSPFLHVAYQELCELGVDVAPARFYGAPDALPPAAHGGDAAMTPAVFTPASSTPAGAGGGAGGSGSGGGGGGGGTPGSSFAIPRPPRFETPHSAGAHNTSHDSFLDGPDFTPIRQGGGSIDPFLTPSMSAVMPSSLLTLPGGAAGAAGGAGAAAGADHALVTPSPVASSMVTPMGAPPPPRGRKKPSRGEGTSKATGRLFDMGAPSTGMATRSNTRLHFADSTPGGAGDDMMGMGDATHTPAAMEGTPPGMPPPPRRSSRLQGASVAPQKKRGNVRCMQPPPPPLPADAAAPQHQPTMGTSTAATPAVGAAGEESDGALARLLHDLGAAYCELMQCRHLEAVQRLRALPSQHFHTGFVQTCLGRALFELSDDVAAEKAFRFAMKVAPHRLDGLEVFSTLLWGQKRDVDLCQLAQHALEIDRTMPQSWIVLGNCYSLQKQPETALKFFKRAMQVDPHFTYAYKLSGDESISNEDFDGAIAFYRNAIRTNPRDYRSWTGLGYVFWCQEKFKLAKSHYERALQLNPHSAIIHCYLGLILQAMGDLHGALAMVHLGLQMEPNNTYIRFNKAKILIDLGEHEGALRELRELHRMAPKESEPCLLIGQLYKELGRREDALLFLNMAVDLEPSDMTSSQARMMLDSLGEEEEEVGDEGDEDDGGGEVVGGEESDSDDDSDDGMM